MELKICLGKLKRKLRLAKEKQIDEILINLIESEKLH